jgi:signal transduction histidine kinase
LAHRVLAAGDADRQRIERDLHDGVQQRLTGLRIRLALATESFQERGDKDASAALNGFGEEVQQAIDEVRAFARGVYPPILASEGLGPALVSTSRHAAAPVTVSARGILRCRPEVESAVYFTCLAAIDNAAKHAGPAEVSVRAWSRATRPAAASSIRHVWVTRRAATRLDLRWSTMTCPRVAGPIHRQPPQGVAHDHRRRPGSRKARTA